MIKKILVGTMLAALIGVLLYGAWYRTTARAASESGSGQGRSSAEFTAADQLVAEQFPVRGNQANQSANEQTQGNGNRGGNSIDKAAGTADPQAEIGELVTLFGVIESSAEDAVVIQVPDHAPVDLSGRGWTYAQEQGFGLWAGDKVRITGFYENEAFELVEIENFTNRQTITLREQTGRPMWAGGRGRG